LSHINIKRVPPSFENKKLVIQMDIDARWLNTSWVERLDNYSALSNLFFDCLIAKHHTTGIVTY
jgi:hypothetical protein